MAYKVSEEQFAKELWINCYCNQITGYPVGHPQRMHFEPIIPVFRNSDGTYNRERTIDGPAYTFTDEQKQILLAGA